MAALVGFWRFMDDVHEMTFPGASIDWSKTPIVEKVEPSPINELVTKPQPTTKELHHSDTVNGLCSSDAKAERVTVSGESSSEDNDDEKSQGKKDDVGDRGQKSEVRHGKVPVLGKEDLVKEENSAKVNTDQLVEGLNMRNRQLLEETKNATKWQDAASMVIKEAKDEVETRKQEVKAARMAGLQAAAKVQRKLEESKSEISELKRKEALVAEARTKSEAEHREEMSVAEEKIEELQNKLHAANSNVRKSIEQFAELSQTNKETSNQLAAKDQKLTAKDGENKVLQGQIEARDLAIQDINIEAEKDRKACNKYCREKFESEKAQRLAERKTGDLEREAIRAKARTDRAMKALQAKLDESVLRETRTNARATKAEGDIEQLKRELDNTESARQMFEKKEGEWAALFATNEKNAGIPSRITLTAANASASEVEQQIWEQRAPDLDLELPGKIKELEGGVEDWKQAWKNAENKAENWMRGIRRELKEKNQTVLATERAKIRHELDEEKRKALAAEQKTMRGNAKCALKVRLIVKIKSQENKERERLRRRAATDRVRAKKRQVEWSFDKPVSPPLDVDRSKLETQIRSQLQAEFQNELSNFKTQWEVERLALERSKLESQIRTQLRNQFQTQLSNFKTQWEVERLALERSQLELQIRTQLEPQIRTQLQDQFQTQLSNFKTQWEVERLAIERSQIRTELQNQFQTQLSNFKTQWEAEHSSSQVGLEFQKKANSEHQIEVDIPEEAGSAITGSVENDRLLASLSRESDETHELFQEIGEIGLPTNTAACTVLQRLNHAKDVLYEVKCEIRKPDTIADKNNLLALVKGLNFDGHYIQQLNPVKRRILIRQANEANKRLQYVQQMLGTNEDVPKVSMLESLLAPLKPESDHEQIPAPPQTANVSGFPQNLDDLGRVAAPGISSLTAVYGSGNLAALPTSSFQPVKSPGKDN